MKAIALTLVLTLALCGCSPNQYWIEGEWIFDKEHSLSQIPNGEEFSKAKEWITSLPDDTSVLYSDGIKIVEQNGGTSATPYKLVETPDQNSVYLVYETYAERYYKEGYFYYTKNSKVPGLKFYYRRKQ